MLKINWELIKTYFKEFLEIFTTTLFNIGDTAVTLLSFIYFISTIILLFFLSGKVKGFLVNRVLKHYHMDIGISQSIGTIVRYFILIIGMFVIIQSAGIDLSALSLLAGALGVGIGLGLQNITNNFISGVIILFERPIKVGDRIEVGEISGDVVKISARATTIVTNDNISVIVPNSDFISNTVINWSHNERMVRFRFPVGVSYNENPEVIQRLLLEVVKENNGVLKNPPPDVLFDEFGDSSINFSLRVWTIEYINRPKVLKSQLYYAIFKKFVENNISIPFPQRDLHIKSVADGDEMRDILNFINRNNKNV